MKKYRMNIDGKEVFGLPGQTILEVAQDNDIFIPTLCYDERTKIYGACGICVVEVEGNPKLCKACATDIAPGMVVKTSTERVLESRKTNLELLVSNHNGDCKGPCSLACPAGTDCQGYVGLIANGEYEKANELIKDKIPLPAAIGRVCPHPCEDDCRRALIDEPISIMALKRFAADTDLDAEEQYVPEIEEDTGKSVAIIGGGPMGLSAAYFLRQIDGRNVVMVGDPFMVEDYIGDFPVIEHRNERVVYEMQEDYVHMRIDLQGMADYALHPQDLLPRAETVGVVIHGSLHEQEVRDPALQYVLLKAESMWGGTQRGDPCGDEFEFRLRETGFQVLHYQVFPSGHFGDGASEESHCGLLLYGHGREGIVKVAAQVDDVSAGNVLCAQAQCRHEKSRQKERYQGKGFIHNPKIKKKCYPCTVMRKTVLLILAAVLLSACNWGGNRRARTDEATPPQALLQKGPDTANAEPVNSSVKCN